LVAPVIGCSHTLIIGERGGKRHRSVGRRYGIVVERTTISRSPADASLASFRNTGAVELPFARAEREPTFDGEALFDVVGERGPEGVVAKRPRNPYRPRDQVWIKTNTVPVRREVLSRPELSL
jgi:hypothetical protein